MRKTYFQAFILCFFLILLMGFQAFCANEDTAHLTFSKTGPAQNNTHIYTVQRGDILSAIIRRLPGVTEKDIPQYYQMIKELNTDIRDLDKLYTGQKIILPGESLTANDVSPANASAKNDSFIADASQTMSYRVRKNDTLIRIIHRELNIKHRTQKTLLMIKSMNPGIKDVNRIYIGQNIRLPQNVGISKVATARAAPETSPVDVKPVTKETSSEEKVAIVSPSQKPFALETNSLRAKESIVLPPAARLSVIKQIISQMNGNMMTHGNYYLPVSKTEQLTIDCSIIPIVELDDHTTILLDLDNRSSSYLKKMIAEHWNNYYFVKIDPRDDIIVILKKIIHASKMYEINKTQSPLLIESSPPIEIMVDWVISKKGAISSASKKQGLRLIYDNAPLLPRAVINVARSQSLIITEISPEKGLVTKPEEIYSLPPVTVLPKSSAREFSHALLSYLNIDGEKDADIQVFSLARDGFNLSIKADMVVTRADKKMIFLSRNLPPQFVSILQKSGHELIFLSDTYEPAKNMEIILRSLQFVFTSGHFTFSGADKNQPPYTFSFTGTKIKMDKDTYVVNFDFNQELRGLLKDTWTANIIRY